MKLHDIENLTAAELKQNAAELAASLSETAHPEIATRYLEALRTAKVRDEKLGEQGETIKHLQASLNAKEGQLAELAQQSQATRAAQAKSKEEIAGLKGRLLEMQNAAVVMSEQNGRLKAVANSRVAALAEIQRLSSVAVGSAEVDAAEAGG